MLHPTKLPACSPILECILDFQEHLLSFACSHTAPTQVDLVAEFGLEVSNWLFNNHQLVYDSLKPFMRDLSKSDKEAVLAQFRHDRNFPISRDDPTFSFELVTDATSPQYLTHVRKWLNGFYEQLGRSGYHPNICGHGTVTFRETDWWNGYYQENPKRLTCAICDASLNSGGRTIEHYLPKSQYPSLSIHPDNLVPLCKTCNRDMKRDKDPLAGRSFCQIYLPYYRDIRSETKLEFNRNPDGSYSVKLIPITNDPNINARLTSLTQLFDIPKRWNWVIAEASEIAFSQLRSYLQAVKDSGKKIDEETLRNCIDRTCKSMEMDWGRLQYRYLATEWLRWSGQNEFTLLAGELM